MSNKNPIFTEQLMKIAGEAGAKAALDTVARITGNLKSVTASDAYKATERRLRALPILRDKVEYDRERLDEYKCGVVRGKSKSITRFTTSGSRLDPLEMIEALEQDTAAQIATDEYEIKLIEDALSIIKKDPYYAAVYDKYILDKTDDEIAEQIPCDPSTVRKNRGRLVRQLAVRMYGATAI